MKRNKWKNWKYDAKHSSVRKKIKRKTNKRERFLAKEQIKKILNETDY